LPVDVSFPAEALEAVKGSEFEVIIIGNKMVPGVPPDVPTSPPKYKLLVFAEFVIVHTVPLVQVGVIDEVIVVPPDAWSKVPNAIVAAATLHVPITVPEAVIVPVTAKVLFAVDISNAELISNNFFNLFIFFILVV
jgi:hypothetical protein